MNSYAKEDIEIISASAGLGNTTEVTYRPILDTIYFCPGATVKVAAERTKVSFVRCALKEKCAVDASAERLSDGKWKITILAPLAKIDLLFRNGEVPLPADKG